MDESREALARELASLPRVVLDDVDRVPVEALDELAQSAPDPELVCTSRKRLALPGEHLIELEPLTRGDAIALFDDLARRIRGEPFRDDEREDVRALVEALGGNPGALVLAASRLRVLGPRALRHRLDEPLRVLRDPSAGTSLDALIAWSWDALNDAQRDALGALAAFDDELTVDDAEADDRRGRARRGGRASRSFVARRTERRSSPSPAGGPSVRALAGGAAVGCVGSASHPTRARAGVRGS